MEQHTSTGPGAREVVRSVPPVACPTSRVLRNALTFTVMSFR
jgi:hypothetical protein